MTANDCFQRKFDGKVEVIRQQWLDGLYDFTAVGDVVNTASRLQGQAGGGEIVLSERVASGLPGAVGTPVQLELKGKSEPQTAYRVSL